MFSIKAKELFDTACKNNAIEINIDIETCIFLYVPKMLHVHRTIWEQEDLIIFYAVDDVGQYTMDCIEAATHKNVYLYPVHEDADIVAELQKVVSNNMNLNYPLESLPEYYRVPTYVFVDNY